MQESILEYELIDHNNVALAIKIQNNIFPNENGAINLICSFDKELKKKLYGDQWRETTNFYMCKLDGMPVGITGIYIYYEYPEDGWCGWYGVLPEFRGKGYGRQILDWTINQAREMGLKSFRLYTDLEDNNTAVELYRKIGMIEEPYLAEDLGSDKIFIFSKSLTSDKTEKWDDKMLFLTKQEDMQEAAKDFNLEVYLNSDRSFVQGTMNFEEYKNILQIQYDLLNGLYFNEKAIGDGFEILKSNIISDNFWNIAIINKEDIFNGQTALINIEQQFNLINRQPCIYIPRMISRHDKYKKCLEDNGYRINDTDAYMMFQNSTTNIEVTENIIKVTTDEQFNDFMKVMESAYGGEPTKEDPYAGSITQEYYEAIKESLTNNKFNHFILYKDEIPAVVATLSYQNGHGTINNVGTKKEFQNLGLGRQLMQHLINKFDELGGKMLFLVTEYDSKNEKWYSKQGFKTVFINEQYVK